MVLGVAIRAILVSLVGYQWRQNMEVIRRSEAEERLREANERNAELADKLRKSYRGVTCTVRGEMYR